MSRQFYLPKGNLEYGDFIETLASKLVQFQVKYGITNDELKDMQNIADDFKYRNNACNQVEGFSKQWTAYRNALRYGVPPGSTVQAPVPPTLTPVSPAAEPGATARIAIVVTKIKKNPAYSIADGQDLGIEGAEIIIDPNKMQPHIKPITGTGGKPGFQWEKEHSEGIVVYKNEGDGYKQYGTDLHPDFHDKAPLPNVPAVWKYKCIYLLHDEEVGQWSNEVTFNVGA